MNVYDHPAYNDAIKHAAYQPGRPLGQPRRHFVTEVVSGGFSVICGV